MWIIFILEHPGPSLHILAIFWVGDELRSLHQLVWMSKDVSKDAIQDHPHFFGGRPRMVEEGPRMAQNGLKDHPRIFY